MVRFGKCCDPLPGDEIVGYISRGGDERSPGKLPHDQRFDPERIVDVQWNITEEAHLPRSREGDLPGQEGPACRIEHGHIVP